MPDLFKTQPFKPQRGIELNVERLESRRLLAGNVTVDIETLRIVGDHEANDVEILIDEGDIVVVGRNGTTINGETGRIVVAEGTTQLEGRLSAKLKGGDDRLVIGDGLNFSNRVRIKTGAGDDSVGIGDSTFAARLKIVTNRGDDTVAGAGSEIQKLRLATRGGSDSVSLEDVAVNAPSVVRLGANADVINVDGTTFADDLRLRLGFGDDTVVMRDTESSETIRVRGFWGSDFVSLDSVSAKSASIRLGFGADALVLADSDLGTTKTVHGGLGKDSLQSDIETLKGRSFKFDIVESELATERETTASAESDRAQSVFDVVDTDADNETDTNGETESNSEAEELSVEFAMPDTEDVHGTLVVTDNRLTLTGTTTPGAVVDVSTGGDANFDDGTVTAGADGVFDVTVPLESELDINVVQVRASANGEETVESAEVFLAVDKSVQFDTSLGSIEVQLLADEAPLTVRNFLSYLDQYQDLVVHRAPTDFVVQSGGFRLIDGEIADVATSASIESEFNDENSNLRGTLSMALLGGQPDSGTSGWFLNTSDNQFLDNAQHTVFGETDAAGLAVIDAINALPVVDVSELVQENAFMETPLIGYTSFSIPLSGLLTVTAGAPVVTGSGTSFITEIPADDRISINGQEFVVASVESETQLTLVTAPTDSFTAATASVNPGPSEDNFVRVSIVEINGNSDEA